MSRRTAAVSAPFRPFVPAVRRFTVSGRQRRLHRGRRRPVRVKSASAGWGVRCRFGRGSPHRNRPDRKRLCRGFGKRYPLRKARPRVCYKLTNNCITLLQIPAGKTIRLPVFPESRSPQPFRRVFQPALRCRSRPVRPRLSDFAAARSLPRTAVPAAVPQPGPENIGGTAPKGRTRRFRTVPEIIPAVTNPYGT